MGKRTILLSLVLYLTVVSLAQAQPGVLHGTVDLTYQSEYIWRGFAFFGSKSAIQAGIDLDLYQTGFHASMTGHRANSSGFEDLERWDYSLYYCGTALAEQDWQTEYSLGWVYYNFPDTACSDTDLQELFASMSLPKLIGGGLVPYYSIVYMWPSSSSSDFRNWSGWLHTLGLGYDLAVPGVMPETPEQILHLSAELNYNDGLGTGLRLDSLGNSIPVDHDWSHVVFGVSTEMDLGPDLAFVPAIYHQMTLDKSVNDDSSETWVTAGMKCTF